MQNKWPEVLFNLLFWLCSAWLIISSFSIQSQEIEIIAGIEHQIIVRSESIIQQLGFLIIAAAIMFYLNFYHLQSLNDGASKSQVVFKSLLSFVQGYVIYLLLYTWIFDPPEILASNSLSLSLFIFYFTVSTAYGLGKVWTQTAERNQQLALGKKQAELNLLRSQLHPHFLFNVLNNLLSMVDQAKNPTLTSSLDKLSSLLRYVVYESSGEKVSLQKEIDFLQDFASLQRLRFEEEEVDFELITKGKVADILIEPGLFLPLIENAFSYGLLPEKQSQIRVSFDLSIKDQLIFTVQNPIYPELRNKKEGGTGIISIQNRLKLVYPNKHSLRIEEHELFILELIINLHESDYR